MGKIIPTRIRNEDGTFKKGFSYSPKTQFKKGMKIPKSVIEKRTKSILGQKRTLEQKQAISGERSKNWKGGQERFRCLDCNKVLVSRYAKRCITCKARFYVGEKNHTWGDGKPKCIDCAKQISYSAERCGKCAGKLRAKERSPFWIKDRTKLVRRQERNDSAYYDWRKSVRDRDGWKCKISNGDCLGKVVAHHILPWSKFPKLRYEINNGITLCRFHHPRKQNDEMKLSPYFQSLVMNNSN